MKFRIQEKRKAAGYSSAREFAEAHGYKVKTYTNWEQGAAVPTLETAWELADIFGCSIDDLVGREWHDPQQAAISHDEEVLLSEYRECTARGRDVIHETARGQALLAKASGVGSKRYDAAVNE